MYRNRKPEKHSSGRKTALVVASLVLCFGLCFYLAVEGQRALGAKFVEIRNSGIIPAAEAETPAAEVTPEPVETPKPTATPKPPKFKQRDVWFSEDKEANKTLSNRLVLWQRAFEYLRNDPRTLLCGLSVEGERITEVVEDVHCHNLLVQTLLEGGIPGLLLFLALVFCGVFHAFRLWSQKGIPFWQRLLPLPMFTILLWEMAECVSHFSYGHPPMTLLWFFMGCTVAASKSLKGLKTSPAAEKAIGE